MLAQPTTDQSQLCPTQDSVGVEVGHIEVFHVCCRWCLSGAMGTWTAERLPTLTRRELVRTDGDMT